jgi:hypothetical protein
MLKPAALDANINDERKKIAIEAMAPNYNTGSEDKYVEA